MKKTILVILAITLLQNLSFSQRKQIIFTVSNFDSKILTYQPIQRTGVSDEDYSKGTYILEASVKQLQEKGLDYTYADYWNFTAAFLYLDEPKAYVSIPFQKAIALDSDAICEYIEAFGEKTVENLTNSIPEVFLPFYADCGKSKRGKDIFDVKKYATDHNLDIELVKLMHEIGEADQLYRKSTPVDWSKQTPLDEKNMMLIDSLYKKYGRYIGKDLVGKQLESSMWAVIQHSSIEKMEAYLPVLHDAVRSGNLNQTPFEMLLDRIHCIRYGYQIFGSQFGGNCTLTDKERRLAVKEKYKLE
ncbi:MAG: DUF6624 domain-containing protein [Bacteroidota bacterium]